MMFCFRPTLLCQSIVVVVVMEDPIVTFFLNAYDCEQRASLYKENLASGKSRDIPGTIRLVNKLEIKAVRYTQLASKLRDLKFGNVKSFNMLQKPTPSLEVSYNVSKVVMKVNVDIVPELTIRELDAMEFVDYQSVCASDLDITTPTTDHVSSRYSTDIPEYHANLTYYVVTTK